jgi:sugar fermentation stimulation protein A
VIQRTDCDAFAACHDLDPAYARGLTEAAARGVEVLAYACEVTPRAVRIASAVPWLGANLAAA